MIFELAGYVLRSETVQYLWLLFLIPATLPFIAFLFIRKTRKTIDAKIAEDNRKIAAHQAELDAEKKLLDDFGDDMFNDDGEKIDENGFPIRKDKR